MTEIEALKAELEKVKLERSAYRDLLNDIAKADVSTSVMEEKIKSEKHDDNWCYLPWWLSDKVHQIADEQDNMADLYQSMSEQNSECWFAVQKLEFEAGIVTSGTLRERLDAAISKLRTVGKIDEVMPLLRLAALHLRYIRVDENGELDGEGKEALHKIEAYLGGVEVYGKYLTYDEINSPPEIKSDRP